MKMVWKQIIRTWLIVLIVFNLRSLLIFTLEGPLVHFGGDSGYFTSSGITTHTASYIGYVSLVMLFNKLSLGYEGVVAFQWLLSGIAAICLYYMLLSLTLSKSTAKLFTLFFVTNYELMKWNFFILSDSTFISFVTISSWLITKYVKDRTFFAASGIASLFTSLIRPNGFIIFLCWAIFVLVPEFTKKQGKSVLKMILGIVIIGLFLYPIFSLGKSTGQREIFLYSTNGELIWSNRQWLVNIPPGKINLDNSALGVVMYSMSHPLISAQMFFGKILVELVRVRPFFPMAYNLFLIGNLLPIYLLAGMAINKRFSQIKPFLFIISFQLLLIGATYADWDGRFLAYILPLIIVMSGIGHNYFNKSTFSFK